MLQHIKLREHRALKGQEVVLNNLGHINIICGKNNGGKSSILEAVNYLNKDISIAVAGKEIEKEYFIGKMFPPKAGSFSIDGDAALLEENLKVFFDSIDGKIYFYNDNEKLFGEIFKWVRERRLRMGFSSDILDFFNYFKAENTIKTEIIFPKRKFDFKINLTSVYNPENDSKYINMIKRLHVIKNTANKKDRLNFEKIKSTFIKITNSDFDVVQADTKAGDTEKLELKFKLWEDWLDAENCGIGFSDILYIVFFIFVLDNDLVLIEEPESHLHPELQKRLLSFFVEQKDKQFLIATHSNIFLDTMLVDKIFYTEIQNGKINVSDKTSKSVVLQNLGYSVADNMTADLILFVEGTTDIPVIRTILTWMDVDAKYNIRYLPMCGDFMKHIDFEIFAEKNRIMVLVDNDPSSGSGRIRKELIEKCNKVGIYNHRLNRYAIENYFTLTAIKSVSKQIKKDVSTLSDSISVESQLGCGIKDNNLKIISKMTEDNIKGTDLYEFCLKLKDICKKEKE